jgi:hypothetical protein
VPFPPLAAEPGERQALVLDAFVEHAARPRRIGLLLVRLGGHSIGIAENGHVLLSTTDRKQVHGRSKAGGWSQQRFARRREGQAREALRSAADDAVRVLVPHLAELVAVVLGGDRRALATLRTDRRLAGVFALAGPAVLDDAAERAREVEILVTPP